MIRVTQIFTCDHALVADPKHKVKKPTEKQRTLAPHKPVEVFTQGHSVLLEDRVCLCTGAAVPMKRAVKFNDPDVGRAH